nr:cytochrome c oxidase assembly protein [Kibdelosporangium sp. MJ126-NF4]
MIGGSAHVLVGDADPGAFVRFAAALARYAADGAGALTVGGLLYAVFIASARRDGVLKAEGYAGLRVACWAATAWLAAAGAMVVLDVSDSSGQPLSELDVPRLLAGVNALETPKAWLITAVLAFVLTVACRIVLTWLSCAVLAVIALVALLPPVVSGHAAVGAGHDIATDASIWHVTAAAAWVGTLVVVAVRRRKSTERMRKRFTVLSTVCFGVLAVSGVLEGLVLTPVSDILITRYGVLLLVKVALLAVLALFLRRALWVQVLVMAAGIGVSVGMARQPPSGFFREQTPMDTLIGYDISASPSVWDFVTAWRFSLIFGTAAIALAVAYLLGLRTLRRRGDSWPVGRTVAWLLGCLVLLLATSSGVGRYAPGVFSVHMVTHMVLNMLAPVLLVLGAPTTLALRALRPSREEPGPREWLLAVLHSRFARVLTNPLVACALLVGSYYALYLTGLFDQAVRWHWAHLLMNTHFLLVGYLFYWTVIGIDPGPRRPPYLGRLAMLFAVMPFHGFFGVIIMSSQGVIAENFYRSLAVPWIGDLLADQRLGGGIAWASGELPVLVVVIALLVQWSRSDERDARRHDRNPESDDELAAYNAMLSKLAKREQV